MWGFNPAVTRIPDAHYVHEARYHGAKIVSITPDYSQSSIHADLWLSPRPGTDAALALAACQVVIEENLYEADYLREQTDLPFLIRSDNGRFLRESDVLAEGAEDRFAMWDEAAGAVFWAPGTTGSSEKTLLLPEGVVPALEARAEVTLADGRRVQVRPAFSLLRERLAKTGPEQAAQITGISSGAILRFAREFAKADSALILSQWGMCKNLHSDLVQRSQILLASLTGNLGRIGGGWRSGAFIALDGMGLVAMQDRLGLPFLAWTAARSYFQPDAVRHEFESMYMPSTIFHAVHGGLAKYEGAKEYGDPQAPRSAGEYMSEAIRKGHFPVVPAPDKPPPEIIFTFCGNVLCHSRMGNKVREALFEPARLVVDVNFRMNETGRHADILLPSAGWYEKIGIKYIAAFVPYVTLADKAVDPLGESKPEWEIFSLLAKHVAAAAQARGVTATRGFRGEDCELTELAERFSDSGRFGPDAQEAVVEFILSVSGPSSGIALEDLRREGGALRIQSLGMPGGTAGIYSEYSLEEPVVPLRDFVEKKQPYPTLTGRQQFYVDHDWFLELGEELPIHKDPPLAGGNHPFTLTGGHARWSIHSMWRDHALMLRLQRGEPIVYLNPADAGARGIADHDLVRIWNELGEFVAHAKITPGIRPSQIHILHAWEPYQFRNGGCHQYLAPSPFKATQLVGDYGHLRWGYAHYEPNQVDRDTRVDLERFEALS
jgi:DMSO reductase family type II enzyme molybdopterin subunit